MLQTSRRARSAIERNGFGEPLLVHDLKHYWRTLGSQPRPVRGILSDRKIRYSDFISLEFGVGKGRVLLIASEFPFTGIVGIEFSAELVKAAREKVSRYRSPLQKARQIGAE